MTTMTWGEFKQRVEATGVTDDHVVGFIDVDPVEGGELSVETRCKKGTTYFDVEDAQL